MYPTSIPINQSKNKKENLRANFSIKQGGLDRV